MRFKTPCSRIRSSLVETPSSSSFLAAGLAGVLAWVKASNGNASVEVTMEAVPARKVRRGVFIRYPSMIVNATDGAKTHKQYNSHGMLAVSWIEKRGLAVERDLSAECGCYAGNETEVAIVAGGVSLDAREKDFVESRRFRLFA